eukprot:jgi/Astpho2/7518/Aster-02084
MKDSPPQQVWQVISKDLLRSEHPFALHRWLLQQVYSAWDVKRQCLTAVMWFVVIATHHLQGPIPVWIPNPLGCADTNLARFMHTFQGSEQWQQHRTGNPTQDWLLLQQVARNEPEAFWHAALQQLRIKFCRRPDKILQSAQNPDECHWLPGARLNIAESALSARDPDAPAVVWAEEGHPQCVHSLTLGQLRRRSVRVAVALKAAGIQPGQAVAINMPMSVWAVALYLGIVYAGCAVVGIADSFAPKEIQTRLRIAAAAAIFTQDVIARGGKTLPLYQRVAEADAARAIVLPATEGQPLQVPLREGDISFDKFLAASPPHAEAEPVIGDVDVTSNILFSSGTTGEPKAIPWSHVTPIRCAIDAWAHQDVRRGDVVAWPTNLGWMMGPWLVYAALLNGAAIALYQGAPLGRSFGVFVQRARVTMLGLVPSIVRAWRASSCMQASSGPGAAACHGAGRHVGLDWSALRCYSSSGEASSPEDYHWLMALAGYKPVIEYCGGTEIGGGFLTGTLLQAQAPSHFSTPTIGARLALLDGDMKIIFDSGAGESTTAEARTGELAVVPPMLGISQRLLHRDHHKVYYKGMPVVQLEGSPTSLRRHGDEVEWLPGNYWVAHGRTDDTMNLGGIKVSSVELERTVVSNVALVSEAAAVGLPTPGGGPERLLMFLVLHSATAVQDGAAIEALKKECQVAIRSHLNPLFKLDKIVLRDSLPRTASNKVMRRVLRTELQKPTSKL